MKFSTLLSTIFILLSCSSNNSNQNADYPFEGKIEKRTYINNFFSLILPIENSWTILNELDVQKSLNMRRQEMVNLGNPISEEDLAKIETENQILLILTQGNQPQETPTIILSYSPLPLNPAAKDELAYIAGYEQKVKTQYQSLGIDFSFSSIEEIEISGIKFKSSLTSIRYEESYRSFQRIYCSIQGNRFLNMAINYSSETELALIKRQLNKIEIK